MTDRGEKRERERERSKEYGGFPPESNYVFLGTRLFGVACASCSKTGNFPMTLTSSIQCSTARSNNKMIE